MDVCLVLMVVVLRKREKTTLEGGWKINCGSDDGCVFSFNGGGSQKTRKDNFGGVGAIKRKDTDVTLWNPFQRKNAAIVSATPFVCRRTKAKSRPGCVENIFITSHVFSTTE